LFHEIAAKGAIVSEFPLTMPPLAYNFPKRNRIISGLCLGVIVAEAAQKSGALITADFALEQGRDVFAIPGKIDTPTAQGVNNLIKQGAKVVTAPEDILEDLQGYIQQELQKHRQSHQDEINRAPSFILSNKEEYVLKQLGHYPKHINELTSDYLSTRSQMAAVLLELELKHLIRQCPGKMYTRC
jgi:DNA processing protein